MIQKTKSVIDPDTYVTISDLATCNLQLAIMLSSISTPPVVSATPKTIANLIYQHKQEEYDAKETVALPS